MQSVSYCRYRLIFNLTEEKGAAAEEKEQSAASAGAEGIGARCAAIARRRQEEEPVARRAAARRHYLCGCVRDVGYAAAVLIISRRWPAAIGAYGSAYRAAWLAAVQPSGWRIAYVNSAGTAASARPLPYALRVNSRPGHRCSVRCCCIGAAKKRSRLPHCGPGGDSAAIIRMAGRILT